MPVKALPFVLMLGRKINTRLTQFGLKNLLNGEKEFKSEEGGESEANPTVHRCAARDKIMPGDWVKIRSGRIVRGLNKF